MREALIYDAVIGEQEAAALFCFLLQLQHVALKKANPIKASAFSSFLLPPSLSLFSCSFKDCSILKDSPPSIRTALDLL